MRARTGTYTCEKVVCEIQKFGVVEMIVFSHIHVHTRIRTYTLTHAQLHVLYTHNEIIYMTLYTYYAH